MDNVTHQTRFGVVLAGGRSLRMGGGDKALALLGGRPVLAWVIAALGPQVSALALNANGDPSRFETFGLETVPDDIPDWPGPLAGIVAAMDWAAARSADATHVLTVPADTPFLPADLVARLTAASGLEKAAIAASGGRRHPVIGLWPLARRSDLRDAIRNDGLRKVEAWTEHLSPAIVDFGVEPHDPFQNINTPEDLAAAERRLRELGAR